MRAHKAGANFAANQSRASRKLSRRDGFCVRRAALMRIGSNKENRWDGGAVNERASGIREQLCSSAHCHPENKQKVGSIKKRTAERCDNSGEIKVLLNLLPVLMDLFFYNQAILFVTKRSIRKYK